MEIEINNNRWQIKLVTPTEMEASEHNDYTLGLTIYKNQEIWLVEEQKNILRTLKHELTHVWLYEYGHYYQENFKNEDICEIVASSNDFINRIIEQIKKEGIIK